MTLYSANYMRSDALYKAVVMEIPKRDGLRSLQLMMMMFGGRWTEEVRTRLAANGCVEALMPLQIRLCTKLKDAADKLEQVMPVAPALLFDVVVVVLVIVVSFSISISISIRILMQEQTQFWRETFPHRCASSSTGGAAHSEATAAHEPRMQGRLQRVCC